MHNLLGLAGYFTGPLSLFALGWETRRWSKATHLSILGFIGGGLALLSLPFLSPDFKYVGVAQRILEGSVLAWVVVCALYINGSSSGKAA